MQYISSKEYSEKTGISLRRIQQLCKNGLMDGARKDGKIWLIPFDNAPILPRKKPLPIGISDYKSATLNYYYVDKTLLIKDFLDERPVVSLFTRPRRFGKSLNLDMIRIYFELSGEDTSIYFQDKEIWKCGDEYRRHQGQYPAIYLSFKDVKCSSWQETLVKIKNLISLEFIRHSELQDSPRLSVFEKEIYFRMASGKGGDSEYEMALEYLSLFLEKHYEKKCLIIIDEYDTPILQGYSCHFYNETIAFMRNLFSGGLKDNPHLAFGFLSGILRVAKESIFSGMNNLKVNSILDERYSRYFGFTQCEVEEMLQYYGKEDRIKEITDWYNGYRFGETAVYNPWSVVNYISNDCVPGTYWQSTGSNEIIGELICKSDNDMYETLGKLLNGESVMTYIDDSVVYPDILDKPYSLYSFLLLAGYLKVDKIYPQFDGNLMCDVSIPNKEISYVYRKEILDRTINKGTTISIKEALYSGNVEMLQKTLECYMLQSISTFDGGNEGFYHGLMLGLCAVLGDQYRISSNRESGIGRFDIQLSPISRINPGFIFEFKHTKNDKEDLDALAEKALEQIEEKKYDTELLKEGVNPIIKIGIAFSGKRAAAKRR